MLNAFRVKGNDIQVLMATFKALFVVNAVDDQEHVGPVEITLAVEWCILPR